MTDYIQSFDALKIRTLKLQGEIEYKLGAYCRTVPDSSNGAEENEPLLEQNDLQELFDQFSEALEKMSDIAYTTRDLKMERTVTRMREIHQSFLAEYHRNENRLVNAVLRSKLLDSPRMTDHKKTTSDYSPRNDFSLRENDSVQSSHRLLDDHIAIAFETRQNLNTQRTVMKQVQTRMNDMWTNFPRVNSLVQRIDGRKRREAVAVGLVVAICTFLILMYLFW